MSKKKIAGVLASVLLIILIISMGVYYFSGTYDCYSQWRNSHNEHKYESGKCFMLMNERWIPVEQD